MPTETSSIPAFKRALHAALIARPALADVQVTYGVPLPNPRPEFIWLADVEGEQEARALGRHARREDMSLEVRISVLRQGPDQMSASERAFVLLAELEDVIRLDPTLDATYTGEGQILAAQITGPLTLQERADDRQREALVTAHVTWSANLGGIR